MIRRFFLGLMILAAACGLLVGSAGAAELKSTTLTWSAGAVGGGWYVVAGGISGLVAEKEPKIVIKVVPGGGVVNPVRLSRGRNDLGWGVTFMDKMAYKGVAPTFKKPNPGVRAIGGVFGLYHVHFLAAKKTGVTSLAQMAKMIKAGKSFKVAAPKPGLSDLPLVNAIMGFYGISLADIDKAGGKVFNANYSDMVSLYKDHHVDFVFTQLALPGAAITEMTISRPTGMLKVADDCIDEMHKSLGSMSREGGRHLIPKGTYKGLDQDVPTVVTAGEMLVGKHVSDQVAYTITKIICENTDKLYQINVANKTFIPKEGWKNVAVPLHPGAEKFYKEAGYMK
jgi:hypothetical protein